MKKLKNLMGIFFISTLFLTTTYANAGSRSAEVKAEVIRADGAVSVTPVGGKKMVLVKGDIMPAKSIVETGADGCVILKLMPGAVIFLEPDTRLNVDTLEMVKGTGAASSNAEVKLEKGAVITDVTNKRVALKVSTAHGTFSTRSSTAEIAIGSMNISLLRGNGLFRGMDGRTVRLLRYWFFSSRYNRGQNSDMTRRLTAEDLTRLGRLLQRMMGSRINEFRGLASFIDYLLLNPETVLNKWFGSDNRQGKHEEENDTESMQSAREASQASP
ncbi:MAG: hypothetical protein V1746_04685 [bacterium]